MVKQLQGKQDSKQATQSKQELLSPPFFLSSIAPTKGTQDQKFMILLRKFLNTLDKQFAHKNPSMKQQQNMHQSTDIQSCKARFKPFFKKYFNA